MISINFSLSIYFFPTPYLFPIFYNSSFPHLIHLSSFCHFLTLQPFSLTYLFHFSLLLSTLTLYLSSLRHLISLSSFCRFLTLQPFLFFVYLPRLISIPAFSPLTKPFSSQSPSYYLSSFSHFLTLQPFLFSTSLPRFVYNFALALFLFPLTHG